MIGVSGGLTHLVVAEASRQAHCWNMVNRALNGDVTVWQTGTPTNGGMFLNSGIGGVWAKVDGRACKVLRPTLAAGNQSEVQIGVVQFGVPFRADFANGGGGALQLAGGEPDLCATWQAWLKKFNNVDPTSARQFFGFYNSNAGFLGASAVPSRVGLAGDGLTGFRFQSNSCPDGAPGVIALGAADANSVQPLDLVQPGLDWFHVRIKLLPATPSQPGRVACYLNGRLVALFSAVANLPRGSNGVALAYSPLNAVVVTDFDGVTQLGGFHMYAAEFWLDKDYNL